jgi:hypothetical protein
MRLASTSTHRATPAKKCNLTHLTGTCESTNNTVTVSTYAHGNVSHCTFDWNFNWGDGHSTPVRLVAPHDGWSEVANHSYAAPGVYKFSATGKALGANCTLTPFTATFKLIRSSAPAPQGSHVRVLGLVACTNQWPEPLPGPKYEAARVRFLAANGEAHDATISNRFSYHVDFNHVPAKGETVFVYVTCKLSSRPSWATSFKLTKHLLQLQYLNLIRL